MINSTQRASRKQHRLYLAQALHSLDFVGKLRQLDNLDPFAVFLVQQPQIGRLHGLAGAHKVRVGGADDLVDDELAFSKLTLVSACLKRLPGRNVVST